MLQSPRNVISLAFLVCFLCRVPIFFRSAIKTTQHRIYLVKLIFAGLLVAVQTATLVVYLLEFRSPGSDPDASSHVLSLLSALAILALETFEHSKIIQPSPLVTLYLLASIIQNGTEALHVRPHAILYANLLVQIILLLLESWPKTSFLVGENEYSPEETSGIIGKWLFLWVNSFLWKGYRGTIRESDVFPLDQALKSQTLEEEILKIWQYYKDKKHGFLRANAWFIKWNAVFIVPVKLLYLSFQFGDAFLIEKCLKYLETPAEKRHPSQAHELIALAAVVYIGRAITSAQYVHMLNRCMTRVRGGDISLIFNASLSKAPGSDESKAVTLISNDIEMFSSAIELLIDIWAPFLQIIIGTWLLWRQLGAVSIAPLIIVIVMFGIQKLASAMMPSRQQRWLDAVQRRIGISKAAIQNFKSVKLSGLSDSMIGLLQSERERELRLARPYRMVMTWVNIIVFVPNIAVPMILFAGFSIQSLIWGTPPLTASKAFTSLSLVSLIGSPTQQLLISLPRLYGGWSSLTRIEDFLTTGFQEVAEYKDIDEASPPPRAMASASHVVLKHFPSDQVTKPITFGINPGSVTAIVGPVGSGKSILLRTFLGEVLPQKGSVSVPSASIGYCAANAWIQKGTVRHNVVGPLEFDEAWYDKVVEVCDLRKDFARMKDGDSSEVGTGGSLLSGGQKHRLALARALYSKAPLLILDDLFSSLDQKTRAHVLSSLLEENGHAKRHSLTVVFATHLVSSTKYADSIIVLEKGGNLKYTGPTKSYPGSLLGIVDHDENDDAEENSETPDISEELKSAHANSLVSKPAEEKKPGGEASDWMYYFSMIGAKRIIITINLTLMSVSIAAFNQLWLKWYTDQHGNHVGIFIGVFATVALMRLTTFGAMVWWLFGYVAVRSASQLHYELVKATFNAPPSTFQTVEIGSLINRYSSDMSVVDIQLPLSVLNAFFYTLGAVVDSILVCLGSTYMVFSLPPIMILLYMVGTFYLKTSRPLREIDLEARTPVYSHLSETVDGIETIRALRWQDKFRMLALEKLETSQKPMYLMFCIQRWLNITLDLLGAGMGLLVITLAVSIPSSTDPGLLGVSLTTVLLFASGLRQLVMMWTQMETQFASVSRTKKFKEETPNENEQDSTADTALSWPAGNIHSSKMTIQFEDGTVALKGVSFDINAGQKIGICGRTGSGKSTLVSVLLRMLDPKPGTLSVDGQDITSIHRKTARENIICLPQEAMVFPLSFTFNIDPENRDVDPTILTDILKKVGLWQLVESRGGLDGTVEPQGLSQGEMQLLALARALVRRHLLKGRCILVLDEATSSLDDDTQTKFQEIIESDFKDNTVISVAHRLEVVKNTDMIIVLDKGKIVKMGPPAEVLALIDLSP